MMGSSWEADLRSHRMSPIIGKERGAGGRPKVDFFEGTKRFKVALRRAEMHMAITMKHQFSTVGIAICK